MLKKWEKPTRKLSFTDVLTDLYSPVSLVLRMITIFLRNKNDSHFVALTENHQTCKDPSSSVSLDRQPCLICQGGGAEGATGDEEGQ